MDRKGANRNGKRKEEGERRERIVSALSLQKCFTSFRVLKICNK